MKIHCCCTISSNKKIEAEGSYELKLNFPMNA